MFLLILFFILSIIISRYLDKKMKIASIMFSILFFVLTFYILVLSDIKQIDHLFTLLLTKDTYDVIKNVMFDHYKIGSTYINIYIIIEFIIFIFSLFILFIFTKKIIKEINKITNKTKYSFIDVINITYRYIKYIFIKRLYIYRCCLRY